MNECEPIKSRKEVPFAGRGQTTGNKRAQQPQVKGHCLLYHPLLKMASAVKSAKASKCTDMAASERRAEKMYHCLTFGIFHYNVQDNILSSSWHRGTLGLVNEKQTQPGIVAHV